jgi:hypothetical protein
VPQASRGYTAGRFVLELEEKTAGFLLSVEGGEAFADVVNEPVGPDGIVRKHPGSVAFSPIVTTFGVGMTKSLYDWMADLLTGKVKPKNGAIIFLDFDYKEQSRVAFDNAVLTEIALPAVDTASRDAAHFSLTLQPEATRRSTASSGAKSSTIGTKSQKKWNASNCRLKIAGLE